MKNQSRILFLMLFILMLFPAEFLFSQGSNARTTLEYFNKTEIGTAIGFGTFKGDVDSGGVQKKLKNDQLIFPIQTINGFIIAGRVGIGIGVGIEFWKDGLFYPVFGHAYYDFSSKENSFFASMNLGAAIGTREATSFYAEGKGGLLFTAGVGYKMKVLKRLQFVYEVYYRYQAIESSYRIYFDAAKTKYTTVDDKFPYNFAGFKIGIFFH
jgi:hypothetical protein